MAENRRRTGSRYEQLAAEYLTVKGLVILEQNYRGRHGEIDLVARDGTYLVFVEVKYRKDDRMGTPAESVDARKQQRIRRTAREYLYIHRHGDETPCRFDVVSILGDRLNWIPNAF